MKPLEASNTLATYSHSCENWSSEVGKAWQQTQSTSIVIEKLFGYWFTFYDMLPLIVPCFIFKSTLIFFPITTILIQTWPVTLLSGDSVQEAGLSPNYDFDLILQNSLTTFFMHIKCCFYNSPQTTFFKAKEFVGDYRHKGCFVVKEWGEADSEKYRRHTEPCILAVSFLPTNAKTSPDLL